MKSLAQPPKLPTEKQLAPGSHWKSAVANLIRWLGVVITSQVRQPFHLSIQMYLNMLAKWHRHHGITVNFRPLSGANRASLWFFALSARPLVDRNLNLSDLLRFQQTQHLASVCQALGRTKTYPPGGMCALDLSHINISCKFSTAHHIQPMENASCSTATWAHRRGFSFLKGKCFFFRSAQ